MHLIQLLGRVALLVALVAAPAVLSTPAGANEHTEAPPRKPAEVKPAEVKGDQLFRTAIDWVANGKTVIHTVSNFFAELEDVQMSWEDSRHEGHLRLWFQNPDKYRFEMRPQRASKERTTKLLVGNQMWVMTPSGAKAMHKSPQGAGAIRQMRQDRERLSDLSKFLTLAGLLGKDVRFQYRGPRRGSGTFAGEWVQVDRIAPDGSIISFFFAYTRDARGGIARATYPGVVTVTGDPTRGEPIEHFILKDWESGPYYRFPRTISGYAKKAGAPGKPKRFLRASTHDLRINAKMPPTVFAPPKS